MPPLISREEALSLGELEDRAGIAALVERAWQVRTERFGDSTDMCSLVNSKSGGCAEDCGLCAQSRYAEAATPMHAMMEPEQMLEHARAAEAAGAHRFCMVTQGQGLSRRDFDEVLAGARLVARSGWLAGETPDLVARGLSADAPPALDVHLWDPSTQLRYAPKRHLPERPDPARTHHPEVPA